MGLYVLKILSVENIETKTMFKAVKLSRPAVFWIYEGKSSDCLSYIIMFMIA